MQAFQKVIVCGAGVMGYSIAVIHALKAREVHLFDKDSTALQTAFPLMEDALHSLCRHGFCAESVSTVMNRIHSGTDIFTALPGTDLLVEAISENAEIKRLFYNELLATSHGKACLDKHTLVASNTSSLNVFELAPPSLLSRFYVAHHFVPAHAVPLVEVLPSAHADPARTESLLAHYRSIGTLPILLKKYCPGFLINRLQLAIHKEVFSLLGQEVADPCQLDLAVKASLGIRMPVLGVLQRLDFAGLELVLGNLTRLDPTTPPPKILTQLVEQGYIGVQAGRGFYDYGDKSVAELCRERDENLLQVRKVLEDIWNFTPFPSKGGCL